MEKYNVAVLGATGEVGREMLNVLAERNFPIGNLKALASARSVGKTVTCGDRSVTVEEATADAFRGCDIVLGAASADLARVFAPDITAAGAVFVDNSSAFRLVDGVPLVIPEINPDDAKKNKGIVSNPNCSTIITLVAINALRKLSPIRRLVASTYQAVSGAGIGGVRELDQQARAYAAGSEPEVRTFQHQILFNAIPQIGSSCGGGYTTEEAKMQNEGRKIMHIPDLRVTCTCVRVPVMRSHSISVSVYTENRITVPEAQAVIAAAPGCRLVDDLDNRIYPMPLDTSNQDTVFVGRIREDMAFDNGIALWCCGDQVRKGAATNTVQIAELLVR